MPIYILLAALFGAPVRTITGTFETIYWPDDGTRTTLPTPPHAQVSALVWDAVANAYRTYSGTVGADGKLAIPGVPRGNYLLRVGDAFHEFTASEIDLSTVVAARPDLVYDSGATEVALTVTGLHPFRQGGFFTGDFFEIISAQADVFSRPFQFNTHGVRPSDGATSFSGAVTWGDHSGGTPVGLPDASKHDVLYASNGPHMEIGSGQSALVGRFPDRYARIEGFTLADGSAGTPLQIDLAPATRSSTARLEVLYPIYDLLAPQSGPHARPGAVFLARFDLAFFGSPHTTAFPDAPAISGIPRLGAISLLPENDGSALPPTDYGILTWYHFLDEPLWTHFRQTNYAFGITVDLPGGQPPVDEAASLIAVEPEDGFWQLLRDRPSFPMLGPPRNAKINGADAFAPREGVGTTPTLTWSAPSLGFATGYVVTLVDPNAFFPFVVATAFVREPRFHVPDGVLTPGGTYYARIQAFAAPWDRPNAPLYRFGYPEYFADCVTAGFSP